MNMMQFYLRPLKAAVSQLMHDLPEANDVELRRHLEDLLDHVVVRIIHKLYQHFFLYVVL
jgi:hypothetical protein